MKNKVKIKPFDVAEHLRDEDDMALYLKATLEENDQDSFLEALGTVARAKGMTQLAKDSGLGRESLYKTLSPGANPRFETIMKITHALGLSVEFAHRHAPQVPLGRKN
ncbi:MAG: addiction module antidote protein [Candidatus Adiutrix sp.]